MYIFLMASAFVARISELAKKDDSEHGGRGEG